MQSNQIIRFQVVMSFMVLTATCLFCCSGHFSVVKNLTDSLPHFAYLLHMNQLPKRNDYIGFYAHALKAIPDLMVVKQVVGMPGDVVKHVGRMIFINGTPRCYAKPKSLEGEPLKMGFSGVIPKNKFFVMTPHPDSLDSRYSKMGLIDAKDLVAVAYPIF